MKRRRPGTGSIETLPDGRKRARVYLPDGRRQNLGIHDSEAEANGVIAAAFEQIEAEGFEPVSGITLRGFGRWHADRLERERSLVAIPNFRSILRNWIETAPFADWPLAAIDPKAVRRWIAGIAARPDLSDSWCSQCLVTLRKILEGACNDGIITVNPAYGVKLPRRPARTDEPWTYLEPHEQAALLECETIPEHWRLMFAVAIYTGMRWGELCALRLADVRLDGDRPHIVVRYGKPNGAPKGRRIRRVPVLPACRPYLETWLRMLPRWAAKNPRGLAFPGKLGGFRKVSRVEEVHRGQTETLADWLKAAGIERRVRPHDLRHTCGASLVSGWWGRAWRLEEVRDFLGHSDIAQTQRYAHLAPEALDRAAADTKPTGSPGGSGNGSGDAGFAIGGHRSRHSPQGQYNPLDSSCSGPSVGLARRLLEITAEGKPAGALPFELAEAVVASAGVELALAVLDGGPHVLDRALELADLVLRSAETSPGIATGGSR